MTHPQTFAPSMDDAHNGAASRSDSMPPAPTYYERPLLKGPHWEWNVVTYLFLGGIMGGLGLLALVAREDREDEVRMRRLARYSAFALAAANPLILISHLGRPKRFLKMLRIVKIKSPMSLGVWGLVFYSGAVGANVVRQLSDDRVLPAWMRHLAPRVLTPIQALLGAFTAGYTGVLISATAIPVWAAGKRHIPAVSVASGLASACALSSLLALMDDNQRIVHKLERVEMIAGVTEFALLHDFEKRSGAFGKPLFTGKRCEKLRRYTIVGGIVLPLILNAVGTAVKLPKTLDAVRTTLASLLTLIGGYVLRESLIESGKLSANDPRVASHQPR